jgi:hypothetical protein
MGQLEDYLRGDYLEQLQELDQVRRTVIDVLPVLTDFYGEFKGTRQWPYEVVRGEDPQYTSYYSFSMAAMMLLAMSTALGDVSPSMVGQAVAHGGPTRVVSEQGLRDVLEQRTRDFIRQSNALSTQAAARRRWPSPGRPHISSSRMYGDNDPFTLFCILQVVMVSGDDGEIAAFRDRCKQAATERVGDVYSNQNGALSHVLTARDAVENVFPLLYVVHLNAILRRHGHSDSYDDSGVLRYLRNRLVLNLSQHSRVAGSVGYDVAELVFAMEAILHCDPYALDRYLIDACIDTVEKSQEQSLSWRPTRPIVANEEGMSLLPTGVEVGRSLLRISEMISARSDLSDCRHRIMALTQRFTSWLLSRLVRSKARSGQFQGWHSEHIENPGRVYIHMWQTGRTVLYLLHYQEMLERYRAEKALDLSNFQCVQAAQSVPEGSVGGGWERVTTTEPLAGLPPESSYVIYPQIERDYVEPRRGSARAAPGTLHHSMLLYGPPGTGKTTLAEDIATALGQPLITITPGDFTVSGEAGVESRAKDIFDVLESQTGVVVLFDEIDRLILDRDSQLYLRQGDLFQLLTPGMLTKFRNLRQAARSIFIVCTNFEERIDPAIKRIGRLDDQYLLLPPDSTQRTRIVVEELARRRIGQPVIEHMRRSREWPSIIGETALMVPGELKAAVRRAGLAGDRPAEQLLGAVRKARPAIRLSGYRSRFKSEDRELPTVQEPYAEFLLLLYLVSESGRRFQEDELKAARNCAAALQGPDANGASIDEQVRKYVTDDEVGQRVANVLGSVLHG